MVVKKGFVNSKRYGGKVKLYHGEKNEITFYITFKSNGKKKFKSVGRKSNGWNEKRAFDKRAKMIDKAKFGIGANSDMATVGELALDYFEYSEFHRRNHVKVLQAWNKHIEPVFDKRVVLSLTDKDIAKFQKALSIKKLSDGTINKIVSYLLTVVNYGFKNGSIEYTPFKNIEKIKIDNSRKRFLSNTQITKLYNAVKDEEILNRFVLIALTTGARAASILKLKKSDFDFENNAVTLWDMKRRMFYTNHLNLELKNEIEKIEEDGLVIDWEYEKMRRAMKPIYDKLFNVGVDSKDRVNRISSHSLRHTYASHLAINNTPLDKIQKLMNHADIKITLRYAHLMPSAGKEFVERLYKGNSCEN